MNSRLTTLLASVVLFGILPDVTAGLLSSHGAPPVIADGSSGTYYGPHHFAATPPHAPFPHPTSGGGTHYFAETSDAHHFAWFSATPTTPGSIVVNYDFRPQGGFPNLITAAQKANAVAALTAWSNATGGKLSFVLNTAVPASSIINIGTGDLAALGSVSGPGGTLGLGGGLFSHGGATHSITSGAAWQDFAETWDTTIGNGNPAGTVDYFTVVAQETGHALGLGHTDNVGGTHMMNGSYSGEQTVLTAVDLSHVRSVYGLVPEPSTILLFASSAVCLLGYGWRRRRTA